MRAGDDAPVHRLAGLGRPDVFPEAPPVAALRLPPERDAARGDDLEHLTEVVELLAHDLDEAGHDVDVLDVGEDHVEGGAGGLPSRSARASMRTSSSRSSTRRTQAIPVPDKRPSMRDSATESRLPEGRPCTIGAMAAAIQPRATLREATKLTLFAWKSHILYGAAMAAIAGLVLAPAGSWILTQVLDAAGGGSVLNFNISDLVLSPRGVVLALLWSCSSASSS